MQDDEGVTLGPEYSEPAYMADIIDAIDPVMETVIALTKAVLEMSVAGRSSDDEIFREASDRAFKQVGEAIEGMKRVRFEMDLMRSRAPDTEKPGADNE